MVDVAEMRTGLYLAGEWVDGSEGSFVDLDPATGEELTRVAAAGPADVERAVDAAQHAFRGAWAEIPPSGKGAFLHRLADLVERDADRIAELESLDIGTPLPFVRGMFVPNLV